MAKFFKSFRGACPPYSNKSSWVADPFEGKAYMFGGERPGEENVPTSDLYCLDTTNMTWKDITNSVKFRRPNAPLSVEECSRHAKALPQLSLPACTLLRLHDTSFLLIFGGFDPDEEVSSSRLIVINLRYLEWWYAEFQGEPTLGRIEPTIVAIDKRLYVFGGYRRFGSNPEPHNSFSIAKLTEGEWAWRWKARDVPYPADVPRGTIFSRATPVYHGAKILLAPWRTTNCDKLNFSNANLFTFHVKDHGFRSLRLGGTFPSNVQWYHTFPLDPVFNPPAPIISSKGRGRGRMSRSAPQSTSSQDPSSIVTSLTTSSVLICGWVDRKPEVWRLDLIRSECCFKVDIDPNILISDHTFEGAVVLGNRCWLLGSLTMRYSVGAVDDMDTDSDDSDDSDNNDAYDIYVEIEI